MTGNECTSGMATTAAAQSSQTSPCKEDVKAGSSDGEIIACSIVQDVLDEAVFKAVLLRATSKDELLCEICQDTFAAEEDLKGHQLSTHINPQYSPPKTTASVCIGGHKEPFMCHVCSSLFSVKENLRTHLSEVHSKENEPKEKSSRPERMCKNTASTLVALSLADERITDLNYFRQKRLPEGSKTEPDGRPEARTKIVRKKKASASAKRSGKRKKKGRPPKKPRRRTKRKPAALAETSAAKRPRKDPSEESKSAQVLEHVTEEYKSFFCLKCSVAFATFNELSDHKIAVHRATSGTLLTTSDKEKSSQHERRFEFVSKDSGFSQYITDSTKTIPETTFNNMHGTLTDIGSLDGHSYRSKPNMGAVEKVKLNVSGAWTSKDVWESSSGWEIGANGDALSWKRFESQDPEREFIQHLSLLSWPEQKTFRSAFDRLTNVRKTKSANEDGAKVPTKVPSAVGLKQLKRDYHSRSKRTHSSRKRDASELGGEWETGHNYMCSACGAMFDELREVMHHKWDDHPYCLVTHVTLRDELSLPPNNMMYPQMGRSMSLTKGACFKRKRKLGPDDTNRLKTLGHPGPYVCTFCADKREGIKEDPDEPPQPFIFQSKEKFHIHLLECGGDKEWQGKKRKEKRVRNRDPSKKIGEHFLLLILLSSLS